MAVQPVSSRAFVPPCNLQKVDRSRTRRHTGVAGTLAVHLSRLSWNGPAVTGCTAIRFPGYWGATVVPELEKPWKTVFWGSFRIPGEVGPLWSAPGWCDHAGQCLVKVRFRGWVRSAASRPGAGVCYRMERWTFSSEPAGTSVRRPGCILIRRFIMPNRRAPASSSSRR